VGTLAAAYAELGSLPTRFATAEKARALAEAAGSEELVVSNVKLMNSIGQEAIPGCAMNVSGRKVAKFAFLFCVNSRVAMRLIFKPELTPNHISESYRPADVSGLFVLILVTAWYASCRNASVHQFR
jgi:hypothetical protein